MLKLPTTDNAKNFKLNMALFRLGHSEDFKIVSEWLLVDEKARLAEEVVKTEGTPCYRIQGALQTLTDLSERLEKARETTDKIRESIE